jgi:hypothetical protein
MSQTAAQQLAQALVNKKAEIASTQRLLATQRQQLAVSRAELAAQAKLVDEATQKLLVYQQTLTDPAQRAAIDQSIAALQPKLIALQNQTSGLQSAVNFTQFNLNKQQTAATNIQTQITTEERSASQTGPVPTDTANNTTDTAINTTSTEIPEPISPIDPTLGELGINTAIIATVSPEPISPIDPTLGELGINTAIIAKASPDPIDPNTLGVLGINTDQIVPDQTAAETARLARTPNATGLLQPTRSNAVKATSINQSTQSDWRVRLHLAPNANYLYNVAESGSVMFPLKNTNGVIFPYTPSIVVQYAANYSPAEVVHSNYKIFQYKGSSVDTVTIGCEFTAQDNSEANYLLAVIHFFRSVTKMFYGLDQNPNPGVPPPLCYLTGLGEFQFNNHALVVTQFTYDLPTDVDYIRAGSPTTIAGTPLNNFRPDAGIIDSVKTRTLNNSVPIGGRPFTPMFRQQSTYLSNSNVTYVPTKMKMSITCSPVVSRNQVSNKFSLRDYATGKLLKGGFW